MVTHVRERLGMDALLQKAADEFAFQLKRTHIGAAVPMGEDTFRVALDVTEHGTKVERIIFNRGAKLSWVLQEYKVWKGIDPDKPTWAGLGFVSSQRADMEELMAYLMSNNPKLILRVTEDK